MSGGAGDSGAPVPFVDQIAEWLVSRSGVPPAQCEMVLKEMRAAAGYYCRTGTPIRRPPVIASATP